MFRIIDLKTWSRAQQFEHFHSAFPCTYSMTVKLDITKLVTSHMKLYPSILYALASVINHHDEFKMSFDRNGNLGVSDEMHPCYTVFHKDTETFSNIWTEYDSDFSAFLDAYNRDLALYGDVHDMTAKPDAPENTFPVSMIPWESFEGFNLNLQKGYNYLTPIFTLGRYYQENERYFIPLAVQVHHAVCDGFHVCRLIGEVRDILQR